MTQTFNSAKLVNPCIGKQSQLLEAIQKLEVDATLSASHRVALAEAEFRLAILEETELNEAIRLMQKAITHDPFHPKYYFHSGRLLHRNGDYRRAVHEYRHALKLAPSSHRAYVHLALTLLELEEAEKYIGRAIWDALARGAEHQLLQCLADLDALNAPSKKEVKKPNDTGDQHPKVPCRWNGLWRLSLIEQLSRPKPISKQIQDKLKTGAQSLNGQSGVAEYAMAGLFLLLCGDPPKTIEAMLQENMLQHQAEHPAVQLLSAAVVLAKSENCQQFVEHAKYVLESNHLPLEIICCLHYMKYGPDSALPVNEALNLLNTYPLAMQTAECFKELCLAVLDGYARQAWTKERYNYARLLWRETIPFDPNRISVSHNLALVAAQTKAQNDYGPAWDRAIELRYLHAAAAGDLQVMLEDRRALHLAFAQQSKQRYCNSHLIGKDLHTLSGRKAKELSVFRVDGVCRRNRLTVAPLHNKEDHPPVPLTHHLHQFPQVLLSPCGHRIGKEGKPPLHQGHVLHLHVAEP